MAELFCVKCGRTMNEKEFYRSYRIDKYPPNGKIPMCKKCWTMHVDNWDPKTYLPLLEELDVPYVKEEWDKLLAKYGSDVKNLTGTTILGRYLSKMKLKQFINYRWADTEKIAEEKRQKKIVALRAQGMNEDAINDYLSRDFTPEKPDLAPSALTQADIDRRTEKAVAAIADEFEEKLSEEDKVYLRLKWGKGYRAEEWIKLEQLYKDMESSYDIQSAGHRDTLILACKASLKANQLLDINDVDGSQRMIKVYDTLMKAGNFTAAQNKDDNGDAVDCIGSLVALCESEGFIPEYYTDGPQDKLDKIIQDQQKYTRDLVTEEVGLGNLIENAFSAMQEEKQRIQYAAHDAEKMGLSEEDLLFDYDKNPVKDSDFSSFDALNQELEEADKKIYADQKEGKY